eukprot:TRINITY_DN1144_c0_g1_i2.p4 TRINITY_DN1144_c0_g1~~TRINITY_DN1144_c0_g1_i2.p4  ORF type:complete len:116 (+),score=84.74 TRINITY_DN1144_c0_g1_i2:48-350(+)
MCIRDRYQRRVHGIQESQKNMGCGPSDDKKTEDKKKEEDKGKGTATENKDGKKDEKKTEKAEEKPGEAKGEKKQKHPQLCLLYTSPSPRDQRGSRMPSSA